MKENHWKIIFYKPSTEGSPVKEFIDSLPLKTQTKIYNAMELLQEFGIKIQSPHIKKLFGTKLWELRILGRDNIRVMYTAEIERSFLLLHGFKKKKQKTPRKEILIAEQRLNDYKLRKKN